MGSISTELSFCVYYMGGWRTAGHLGHFFKSVGPVLNLGGAGDLIGNLSFVGDKFLVGTIKPSVKRILGFWRP